MQETTKEGPIFQVRLLLDFLTLTMTLRKYAELQECALACYLPYLHSCVSPLPGCPIRL